MTIEEKLKYLQDASMEDARAMGNEIISEHQEALDQILKEHKETTDRTQTRTGKMPDRLKKPLVQTCSCTCKRIYEDR